MEIRETKKVTKEVEVITRSYTQCDKCGCEVETEWSEVFEFYFEVRTGTSYPSGGDGEKKELDLCQKCSEEAVSLLQNNGFNFLTEKWEY